MLFNSIEFLIFLPIVFFAFWIIPQKHKWIVLLIASYYFYMFWNWKLVFLILFTTVISYTCGLLLERYRAKTAIKRLILALTLVSCLGVLFFFKYFAFFYEILKDISDLFTRGKYLSGSFNIMLPVGISFYTFQTLSYVIDIYKNQEVQAERHFGYYALFVSFFPQLVAGPIERPENLLPQLKERKNIKCVDYSSAFRIMLIGFFKKIAVADVIGIMVNATFNDISHASGLMVIIASVLFSFQIYCDFSGYSDIAVGCAKLFGINLTENFNSPYSSKGIKEFWGRWHISLSSWLKDYIYIPLGGSRVKKSRWAMNILIVFFVSGLWHGANYTFIVWGVLHAVYQLIGGFTLKYRNKFWQKMNVDPNGKVVSVLRIIGTFCLVTFAWIFFRANNIGEAFIAIKKLFTAYSFSGGYIRESLSTLGLNVFWGIYSVFAILFMLSLEKLKNVNIQNSVYHISKSVYRISAVRFVAYLIMAWLVVGAWIYLQSGDFGSSFIYFQF